MTTAVACLTGDDGLRQTCGTGQLRRDVGEAACRRKQARCCAVISESVVAVGADVALVIRDEVARNLARAVGESDIGRRGSEIGRRQRGKAHVVEGDTERD